jgi:hypothetical protein
MGEAKRRGDREARIAAAKPKEKKESPEYVAMQPYSNSALQYLWGQFRMFDDMTVNEFHAATKAKQKELADKRVELAASAEQQALSAERARLRALAADNIAIATGLEAASGTMQEG